MPPIAVSLDALEAFHESVLATRDPEQMVKLLAMYRARAREDAREIERLDGKLDRVYEAMRAALDDDD